MDKPTDYASIITDLRRRADVYRDALCRSAAVAMEELLTNQCKCPPPASDDAMQRVLTGDRT